MRWLVDAQLPPALARWLSANGHRAEHVADIGLVDASDSEIWKYAFDHQAVLVTKDEDFSHRCLQGGAGPVVVWLRIRNVSRRNLLEWFEPLLPDIERWIADGERLIEVRG